MRYDVAVIGAGASGMTAALFAAKNGARVTVFEKNGEPLEKVLRHIYDAKFKRPKQRPYKTNNFYTVLTRQAKLDKEVRKIVQGR